MGSAFGNLTGDEVYTLKHIPILVVYGDHPDTADIACELRHGQSADRG